MRGGILKILYREVWSDMCFKERALAAVGRVDHRTGQTRCWEKPAEKCL